MAKNLIAAGHSLTVFDLVEAACAALQAEGASVAASAAEAASNAEVIISMLPAGKHVAATFLGEAGLLANMIGIGVLHYTLPQNDVVRINDTYEKRIDFGRTGLFWARHSGEDGRPQSNRDVFFIESFDAQDRPIVFRNEDTGWGFTKLLLDNAVAFNVPDVSLTAAVNPANDVAPKAPRVE